MNRRNSGWFPERPPRNKVRCDIMNVTKIRCEGNASYFGRLRSFASLWPRLSWPSSLCGLSSFPWLSLGRALAPEWSWVRSPGRISQARSRPDRSLSSRSTNRSWSYSAKTSPRPSPFQYPALWKDTGSVLAVLTCPRPSFCIRSSRPARPSTLLGEPAALHPPILHPHSSPKQPQAVQTAEPKQYKSLPI